FGTWDPVRPVELHADYLAGWYLGRWRNHVDWAEVGPALKRFYQLGSYDFNNPNFHGTPDQRQGAVGQGLADTHLPLDAAFQAGRDYVANLIRS
ncbi:MAG: hypothetical protein AAGF59_03130, partial [Pseudomonadota bacterium]